MPVTFFGLDCLLFLPAAGFRLENGVLYSTFPDNQVALHGRTAGHATNLVFGVCAGDALIDLWRVRPRARMYSVRLASVVSEELTQTWKCHIVFGIGCPRLSF